MASTHLDARTSGMIGRHPDVHFWRDRDLGDMEVRYSFYDRACFGEHTHDAYSVGIIHAGTTEALLRGKPAAPAAGDIVLIHPDEVHACNPVRGSGWAYHMFYPEREWFRALARDVAGGDVGYPRFTLALTQDAELFEALHALAKVVEDGGEAMEKQTLATTAFSLLLKKYCEVIPADGEAEEREAVTRAKAVLEADLSENLSLDKLAGECGLSRYHLLREFKRATGLPPHAWRMQQRLHLARKLLRQGDPIAEVALATGFTDQPHFTSVFKKAVGTTPASYQRG